MRVTTPRQPAVVALGLIAVLLPLVAWLQYRWVGSLSDLEQQRMQRGLEVATERFRDDFEREIDYLQEVFDLGDERGLDDVQAELVEEWNDWTRDARVPGLVGALHWIGAGPGGALEVYAFDAHAGLLAPAAVPAWLAGFEPVLRHEAARRGAVRRGRDVSRFEVLHPRVPALLIPQDDGRRGAWVAVTLDREVLLGELVPGWVRRDFGTGGEPDFEVLIVERGGGEVVYASAPGLTAADFPAPDEAALLFGRRVDDDEPATDHRWALLVRHQAGSLEAAVGAVRRRNLAVSFGVVLLLGGSVAMLWVSTRRAQALAAQQMGFVAGVTHELRTPLSGISSLSQNLADGVVRDDAKMREYGDAIHRESGRLGAMVDTVLLFSKVQSGAARYELQPVAVGAAVRDVVASISLVAPADAARIGVDVPGALAAQADPAAFRAVVRNVLTNALKFDGDAQPVGCAAAAETRDGRAGVRLTVEDHGAGIDRRDLPHVTEPFYRGRHAADAQIEGSGLGLSIVREVVEAHGGTLTITSRVGEGTRVTLWWPAAGASPA